MTKAKLLVVSELLDEVNPALHGEAVKQIKELDEASLAMKPAIREMSMRDFRGMLKGDRKSLTAAVGSLVVLDLLLASCQITYITPTKTETATVPGQTSTLTVEAPTETPSETSTVEQTVEPTVEVPVTSTPTETAEPTATETAVSWSESRYYEPGFKLEMEGSVEGVSVPFIVGLHPSIMNRESEPIVSVEINRPDTADVYAKFWMTMCWKKYEEQHPEAAGISFSQYMQLVKDGGGEIEIAAVDEATDDQNNKLLTFEPQKGFVSIATDLKFKLPEEISPISSMYFGRNEAGQLIIVSPNMTSEQVTEQKSYDGYEGWTGETLVNLAFSLMVANEMELFLSTNNADLLSSRRYYSLTEFSMIDRKLFLDPQVYKPMFDSKNPFFLIGQ